MGEPLRDDPVTVPPADGAAIDDTVRRNAFESVVHHFLDAGPEVAEHVVGAAQELLLAAQALVTAAERAVAEQRAQREADSERADATSLRSVSDPA